MPCKVKEGYDLLSMGGFVRENLGRQPGKRFVRCHSLSVRLMAGSGRLRSGSFWQKIVESCRQAISVHLLVEGP